jgi:hypothetical protein
MFSDFKFSGYILLAIAIYALLIMHSLFLREKNMTLQARIDAQNIAIQQWKSESDKLTKELKHAEKEAHQMAMISDAEVERLLKKTVSDECCKAIDYIKEDAVKR